MRTRLSGFTILEVLAVIVLLAILAAIAVPYYKTYLAKSSSVVCFGNLKSLQTGFASFQADHGRRWPPTPQTDDPFDERLEDYWISIMAPYGISESTWKCPVFKAAKAAAPDGRLLKIHYIPANFDATPGRAMEWANQPWLMEIGNAHGDGALIAFRDSIKSMNQVMRDNGIPTN
jgi:prepilin-type N-terminal cleavage/methylation domain-containing protein